MHYEAHQGSILDSKAQIIVHQVNCQGKMGSGVAKCIKDAYPVVYEAYMEFCQEHKELYERIGEINIVKVSNKQAVCNLFGQMFYGYDGKRYTRYDAVTEGLEKLRDFCIEKGIKSIAFPNLMGCGLGGGNWGVISAIINSVFEETDLRVEMWTYNAN